MRSVTWAEPAAEFSDCGSVLTQRYTAEMGADTDNDQPLTSFVRRSVLVSRGNVATQVRVLARTVDSVDKIVEFDRARRLDSRNRPAPDEDRAPPLLDGNALARFDAGQIDPDRTGGGHVG